MALINISGKDPIIDINYRYKMPPLLCKVEGRGNGIKTVILNCLDIAKSLHRSVDEIRKFIGYNLCTQTRGKDNNVIVNGEFTRQDLQSQIFEYIDIFVLCECCRLPETIYRLGKNHVYHKCASCGHKSKIEHRLNKFIIKEYAINHVHKPKQKKIIATTIDNSEENIIWYTDLSEEAVAKRKTECPKIVFKY